MWRILCGHEVLDKRMEWMTVEKVVLVRACPGTNVVPSNILILSRIASSGSQLQNVLNETALIIRPDNRMLRVLLMVARLAPAKY